MQQQNFQHKVFHCPIILGSWLLLILFIIQATTTPRRLNLSREWCSCTRNKTPTVAQTTCKAKNQQYRTEKGTNCWGNDHCNKSVPKTKHQVSVEKLKDKWETHSQRKHKLAVAGGSWGCFFFWVYFGNANRASVQNCYFCVDYWIKFTLK